MQNPNFVFGKKKKVWFVKKFTFKNHVLGIKLKASFSKRAFDIKHDKKMGYQTDLQFYFIEWQNKTTFHSHGNMVCTIHLQSF